MKKLLSVLFFIVPSSFSFAQSSSAKGGSNSFSFIDYQKSFPRPYEAIMRKEDTLKKQFEAKKLVWPPKYIYIRSFKYDSQLEVWVKNEIQETFKLFKTYKVCALAGTLGPKRMQGDYQVPEGFYYINVFNPKSNYYLSLGINYPNPSDRVLSDSVNPGGDIYIHGGCTTVGCIPVTDAQMEELYILAAYAKDQGQDFIPIHIFPIRFNVEKSIKYLEGITKDYPELKKFAASLQDAFDYFEYYKQLPVVMIGRKGEYIINDVPIQKPNPENKTVKKTVQQRRFRNVGHLAGMVHQSPQYPGGHNAFMKYLEKLGAELAEYLPENVKKAYVQVEFIVDKDGEPVNFKILRGVKDGDELHEELITRLENMGTWKPALLHDKPVAKKMVQTITIAQIPY